MPTDGFGLEIREINPRWQCRDLRLQLSKFCAKVIFPAYSFVLHIRPVFFRFILAVLKLKKLFKLNILC